jgi:hypothetical protein
MGETITLRQVGGRRKTLRSVAVPSYFPTGTGMPGIFTLTEPRWLRLVK